MQFDNFQPKDREISSLTESQAWKRDYSSSLGAVDKWNKLYKVICSENKEIPLKQMAIKSKHENQLFDKIFQNFTYGKPIRDLKYKIAYLDEFENFENGPLDLKYYKKIRKLAKIENEKFDMYNDIHANIMEKMISKMDSKTMRLKKAELVRTTTRI